jgi:flagellar hook-length control protein FliK
MIDVSTMAPVAGMANATGVAGITPGSGGAAGFLRLFEIVLGGMPGVAVGAVSPASPEAALDATLPTILPLSSQPSLALGEPTASEPGVALVDAGRIAELLGLLGFQVRPEDIQALGGMDRFQLDQAMEFLERGVASGASPDALLENAGYLMPGEWNLLPSIATAPRSAELAPAAFAQEATDPAAILAAAQAVRTLLQPTLVSGELASLQADAQARPQDVALAPTSALPGPAQPVGTPETVHIGPAKGPSLASAIVPEAVGAAPQAARAIEPTLAQEPAASTNPSLQAAQNTPDLALSRPTSPLRGSSARPIASERPEPLPAKVGSAAEGIVVSPRTVSGASRESSQPVASNPAAALEPPVATTPVPAHGVFEAPRPLDDAASIRGVKPGSMASEFIGRQVLEKVDVQLRQGRRELTVRLWPEELGEVRLSLRVGEADRLDARIMVQTESVRQAILDATPQLREALSRHGMEMGRLSVNVDSGATDSRGGSGTAGEDRPRGGQDQQPRQRAAWREESVAYATSLALGIDSGLRDGRNTLDMWS